ncbi:cobyric acid synthase [Thermostilla marina]
MRSFRHGGQVDDAARSAGCLPEELTDFSAAINPLGPPSGALHAAACALDRIEHYPDPFCRSLASALARFHSVDADRVVCGNGSSELLYALPKVFSPRRVVVVTPCYVDYLDVATHHDIELASIACRPETDFSIEWDAFEAELQRGDLVIVGFPNNPTGRTFSQETFSAIVEHRRDVDFVVDEAFADFLEPQRSFVGTDHENLLVLRSLTKFYAIPGLRLGYAVGPREVISRLRNCLPPWSVNAVAQAVGSAALGDEAYRRTTRDTIARLRTELCTDLQRVPGLRVFPSEANYLLVRTTDPQWTARRLYAELLSRRIVIRCCENIPCLDDSYFRVAVRNEDENRRLVDALRACVGSRDEAGAGSFIRRRKPAVMLQGTASNVGKSVLAAAFCRILLQEGYRVVPFKAQNMSLNSFVTREGGEMGRAQVLQAAACRLEPDVRMNPVLLKPNSQTGAQVIVLGKPVGNMGVVDYLQYKQTIVDTVRRAYDELAADFDVVVIEGAGSPAEVNLQRHDIVNMATARHGDAAVYLVGDIDCGGVFAAFVGTYELLPPTDRRRVAGFIINRFRGKPELLDDALAFLTRRTGRHVLGVVPYVSNLGLPEEDSVSLKSQRSAAPSPQDARTMLDVVLVDLPHISNFTDIDPLRVEPDVRLRVVSSADAFGNPDVVVLPGSKNVQADLHWLKHSGLAARIVEAYRSGRTFLVGVCGGLQMLGGRIRDAVGVESQGTETTGLGLLPLVTEYAAEKVLTAVAARHVPSGIEIHGYEIHHGRTSADGLRPAVVRSDGTPIGYQSADGRIVATYLHGLFDTDAFRHWYLDGVRTALGLGAIGERRAVYDIEPALDRLADIVRESVDMEQIFRRMGLR